MSAIKDDDARRAALKVRTWLEVPTRMRKLRA
jgi:hypothetical protein